MVAIAPHLHVGQQAQQARHPEEAQPTHTLSCRGFSLPHRLAGVSRPAPGSPLLPRHIIHPGGWQKPCLGSCVPLPHVPASSLTNKRHSVQQQQHPNPLGELTRVWYHQGPPHWNTCGAAGRDIPPHPSTQSPAGSSSAPLPAAFFILHRGISFFFSQFYVKRD